MDASELDVALEELETRLERLRALYEQYFMGIERVEPAIPRKDVDRRIYVLRREKIRNTAKRFKLQTIIQRYNTFQQYWQRICREIENGTYKRHLIRAERVAPDALLTIAARKRLGRNRASSAPPPEADADTGTAAASSPPSAPPRSAPPLAAQQAPRTPPPRTPAPKVALESLSLDMDFLGDWDPGARFQPPRSKVPAAEAKPPALQPPPKPSALKPPPKPAAEQPPEAPATAQAPAAAQTSPVRPVLNPPPKPALKPPPKPTRLDPPSAAAGPAAPAPEPTKPAASPSAAKPAAAAPPAKPAAAAAAKPAPAKPSPAKPPAAAAPTGARTIADDQVRSLHARLVEAKKQTKESSAVSVEGLTRSLEATAAKLREQHKNRKIEFDVVIKDGKAVVKPIVK